MSSFLSLTCLVKSLLNASLTSIGRNSEYISILSFSLHRLMMFCASVLLPSVQVLLPVLKSPSLVGAYMEIIQYPYHFCRHTYDAILMTWANREFKQCHYDVFWFVLYFLLMILNIYICFFDLYSALRVAFSLKYLF